MSVDNANLLDEARWLATQLTVDAPWNLHNVLRAGTLLTELADSIEDANA